jgi:hypothetical protein
MVYGDYWQRYNEFFQGKEARLCNPFSSSMTIVGY